MKNYIIILLVFLTSAGCTVSDMYDPDPQIVVEGWIENGGYPMVILTTTVPVTDNFRYWEELQNHIIRWGKVTVSDGEKEVVLTGKPDNDYYPPYIYTTARIKGEVGKTYTLTVEYSGRTVTAHTTIPEPVPLEWIRVSSFSDGEFSIRAGLRDRPETKDYYKFFIKRMHKDSTYMSSFLGLIDDSIVNGEISEVIVRGPFSPEQGSAGSKIYYSSDDFVFIRFCTLDYDSFCYWQDYEDVLALSLNPLFPVNKKIRSNVSSGYGYWAGYGSTYYRVSISDSLEVR